MRAFSRNYLVFNQNTEENQCFHYKQFNDRMSLENSYESVAKNH